jgi:hypothetical protein
MKQIQPIQIWNNGQVQTGNWINVNIVADNLQDTAIFYWGIYTQEISGSLLSESNLTMLEPDYSIWNSTSDINQAAYEWVCNQLGLTLI